MKQIQHLYADGFDKEKLRLYRRIIISNILDFADMLITEMGRSGDYVEEAVRASSPRLSVTTVR